MSAATQAVSTTRSAAKRKPGAKHLRALLPYLSSYKGSVALGMLMNIGLGVTGVLAPILTGAIFDTLSNAPVPMAKLGHVGQIALGPLVQYYHPGSRSTLAIFSLALVFAIAVKGVFSYWNRWILIGISRDIEFDLRNDLLTSLLRQEPEFYVRNRTGEIMSRCTNDLNNVRMVLGPGIMYSATTIVTMLLSVVLMVTLSPRLSVWVLLPVPVVAVVVWYFGQVIHRLYEKIQASLATLSAKAQENLAGVCVVRAYAQEKAEQVGFDGPNREYVTRNLRLISTWSMFMPALTTLFGMTFLLVLWQGGRLVMNGTISVGELIAFYYFMVLLIFPMVALGFVTNIFQRGSASMGRINYILDAQPKISDSEARPMNGMEIRGEVEMRHLTFTYPTTRSGNGAEPAAPIAKTLDSTNGMQSPVLRDINLKIPAGSTLAIVGPTGSGKTTLATLIARLWEAPTGSLLIDKRLIREWPIAELRGAIGFVPQDPFLFSETLAENIALGENVVVPEKVAAASVI